MLPGNGSSMRRRGGGVSDGMQKLSSVMEDSARRYKRLPRAAKVVFVLSLLFSGLLYLLLFRSFITHSIADDNFLETGMCPACFGSSACGMLYHDQVHLSGWSSYRVGDLFSRRNIRYGTMFGNQNVVLKKLGSDAEIQKLDDEICQDANRPEGCDVARVITITNLAVLLRHDPLMPKHVHQSAGMFTCASYRLMDRVWSYYRELRKAHSLLLGDKMQLWYTASLNSESLLLQTFPASERWPFPEYFGACGRHVIVEHVGETLQSFYDAPFSKRAGIAYELLRIAEQLTNNNDDFALYVTDPHWDNFGVDASGKVRILDAEGIIVVDKLAIEAKKTRDYDKFLQSDHGLCTDSKCTSMIPDYLCTRLHSDHNYYAICTSLLDTKIDDGLMPGGLLHDMPDEAKDFWDLQNLLNECARPTKYKGRIFAKDKLLSALAKLRDENQEHIAAPPAVDKQGVPERKRKKELWEYDDYDDEEGDAANKDKSKTGKENANAKDFGFDEKKGKRAVVLD